MASEASGTINNGFGTTNRCAPTDFELKSSLHDQKRPNSLAPAGPTQWAETDAADCKPSARRRRSAAAMAACSARAAHPCRADWLVATAWPQRRAGRCCRRAQTRRRPLTARGRRAGWQRRPPEVREVRQRGAHAGGGAGAGGRAAGAAAAALGALAYRAAMGPGCLGLQRSKDHHRQRHLHYPCQLPARCACCPPCSSCRSRTGGGTA